MVLHVVLITMSQEGRRGRDELLMDQVVVSLSLPRSIAAGEDGVQVEVLDDERLAGLDGDGAGTRGEYDPGCVTNVTVGCQDVFSRQ